MLSIGDTRTIPRDAIGTLIDVLRTDGYSVIGPTVRDAAIVYDEVRSANDLPAGWTDVQSPGKYRLERRNDDALFGFAVGPHSYRKLFHVPTLALFRVRRADGRFESLSGRESPPLALLGARSCDLRAIAVQDRTLRDGPFADPDYSARRRGKNFVVALECSVAGGTCFCASMDTGPDVRDPFDLAMTEVIDTEGHRFVVRVGSDDGARVMSALESRATSEADAKKAREIVQRTAASMGRTMDTGGIKELLYRNLEHPRWIEVGDRCLGCTNCTLVCPTCFCTTTEDRTDVTGETAERHRRWDSCFTLDHSYLHGGSVRTSIESRYRQWLTHKLASWIDQFGTSGCVGCGRCVTWCPVGIDIREEVAAIRATDGETR